MCGIAGWFGDGSGTLDAETVLPAMARSLAHRGPDGSAWWHEGQAHLAHTRLAVIDLEGGRQPLFSHDRRFAIVFNGEIYNYRALREKLRQRGSRFLTASDTEVVIEWYRVHGTQGFRHLRGMYAFALWDSQERCGVLVRDPVGIKPLFISTQSDGTLMFGSEAKAIVAATGQSSLDAQALHLLMNFRYLPGQHTLFRGIEQLVPGQILTWKSGRLRKENIGPPDERNLELAPLLEQSVERHLVSDVEVGAYLSGGVDSALLCALAATRADRPLRSFTLPIGDDPAEADNAARTARELGIENLRGDASAPRPDELMHLVQHLEVPKANAWQSFRLATFARRSVKVTLSGLGADELFYGYNAHAIFFGLQKLLGGSARIPANIAGRLISATARGSTVPWSEAERAGLMLQTGGNWSRAYGLLRNLWDAPSLRQWIYGPRMLDQQLPDAFDTLNGLWPERAEPLEAFAEFEWQNKMVNDLLWHEDRASMAVGLEVRVPYLDLDLATQARQRSRREAMPYGRRKHLLRKIAADHVPAEVLRRPKSGFQMDGPRFVLETLSEELDRWLNPDAVRAAGLFNPTFVEQVRRMPPGRHLRWHSFILFLMLQSHMWLQQFEGSNNAAPSGRPGAE